ncbi:hypothetical protein [Nocardia transvalensis]|uniref:hypothetical protein n=1 Tax=Nocardia transvalensis TaxID=37333 RepID=UPI00189602EF|nr:hypothetical protein [Nocardia transvalensis]MBF6327524.1 hypothetical protein [Nocardia transvalensis]
MSEALDQSVLDLLRNSAAGPMLDRPVNDVLRDMGLPQLPDLSALPPLPDLPPLPVLDLSVLAKPLTDLASTFGTGQFPSVAPTPAGAPAQPEGGATPAAAPAGAPAMDPSQLFSQISSVVQTVVSLGTSALQMAMQLWQGAGAAKAEEKGVQAHKDSVLVAEQSAETSLGLANAAGTVFRGSTMMSGIIAKYLTSLAAAGPFLVTPPGQAFVLAMSTETLAEAMAVVAQTRGELTVHSSTMAKTGRKVPVTAAPKGVDPMQMVSQLLQIVPALTSAATQGAQTAAQVARTLDPPKPVASEYDKAGGPDKDLAKAAGLGGAGGGGGAIGGGGGGGIGAAAAAAARPLSPWVDARSSGALGAAGAANPSAGTGGSSPVRGTSNTVATGAGSPGMMPMGPMGAAGALAGRSAEETTEGLRGQLVTSQHGDEVVGDMAGASLPVVGAAERVSEPTDNEPPDKALTL